MSTIKKTIMDADASAEIENIIRSAQKDQDMKREKVRFFTDEEEKEISENEESDDEKSQSEQSEDEESQVDDDDWESKISKGEKIMMGPCSRIDELRSKEADRVSRPKTKFCRFFTNEEGRFVGPKKGKKCPFGDDCGYAHSPDQLIVSPMKKVYSNKTKMCRFIEEGKVCDRGDECRFAHVESEIAKIDLKMTSFCKSVCGFDGSFIADKNKHKVCPHGSKCNFAHSPEQLRKLDCSFGSNCRNVKQISDNVWINVGDHICIGSHPGETSESHSARNGQTVVIAKPVAKPVAKPIAKPAWKVSDSIKISLSAPSEAFTESVVESVVESVAKPILQSSVFKAKVPESLYLKVLEVAIASGKYTEYDITTV